MGQDIDSKVLDFYRVSRGRPQRLPDGERVPARGDPYGQAMISLSSLKSLAEVDDDASFVIGSPTPGTGIATIAAQASLADTAPFFLAKNTNPAASLLRCYIDYIKLIVTAAGTAGTAIRYAAKVDAKGANRYTSGNALAATPTKPVNTGGILKLDSNIECYAGALVATAANGARQVAAGMFRPVIPVVGDTYLIVFGRDDIALNSLAVAGTAVADRVHFAKMCAIDPDEWFQFNIWLPSQSAASSYELEVGMTVK